MTGAPQIVARNNLSEKMVVLGLANENYAGSLTQYAEDLDEALLAQMLDPDDPVKIGRMLVALAYAKRCYREVCGRDLAED